MYQFSLPRTADPERIADCVHTYGLAHLSAYLDPDTTNRLADETTDVLADPPAWSYPEGYSLGAAVRMVRKDIDPSRYPTICEVFARPALEAVVAAFYGPGYVFSEQVYAIRDVVGSRTIVQQPHYDKVQHLKVFFYLTDVEAGNGPFTCVPGSQTFAKQAQQANRAAGVIPTDDDARVLPEGLTEQEVAVLGGAGTLIVFDSDLAHRAGIPQTGPRLAIRSLNFGPDSLGRRV